MDRLLQAIYQDPYSTEKRLVYADALVERGDPRGIFIHLQCLADPGPRERKWAEQLFLRHRRTWLGELWPLLVRPRFERGFLAACGLRMNTEAAVEAAARYRHHPVWNTVESLTLASHNRSTFSWVMEDEWPALRRVYGLWDAGQVRSVLLGRPRPWVALGIRRVSSWPAANRLAIREALREGPGLPDLSELVVSPDFLPALKNGFLVRRLRHLTVQLPYKHGAGRVVDQTDVPVQELQFANRGVGGWSVVVDRSSNRCEVTVIRLGGVPDPPRSLVELLVTLRETTRLGRVRLEDRVPLQAPPSFVTLKRLAWALAGPASWGRLKLGRPESVEWPRSWWHRLEDEEQALPASWPADKRLSPFYVASRSSP